jgi:MoxR-like ATPase
MEQHVLDMVNQVEHAANLLKATFVAKDDLVELLITSAIAQEHLLIVGPPGTAKSELIKRFALLCSGGDSAARDGRVSYFEYLLTRFTEPNEIFGPVNVAVFREGGGARRTTAGMLPRAEIAFLDEVFKANSAILNALLTILNERVFYNGGERDEVPLICAIGATNAVPDDVELAALYDRFLLRAWTDNVEESLFAELFQRGWRLERDRIAEGYGMTLANVTTTDTLRDLYRALGDVDVSRIANDYREVVRRIRAEGIQLSDRRVVKLLKLVAASALRQKRAVADPGDFWILRHVWNDPEQIPHLQTIVDPYVTAYQGEAVSAERLLTEIKEDLDFLGTQRDRLKTDTDFVDFLQQLETLRRQLLRHSAAQKQASAEDRALRDSLLQRINSSVDDLMKLLEANL